MQVACKDAAEQCLLALGLHTNVPIPKEAVVYKATRKIPAEAMQQDPAVIGKDIAISFFAHIESIPGTISSFALSTSITCDAAGGTVPSITIAMYVIEKDVVR